MNTPDVEDVAIEDLVRALDASGRAFYARVIGLDDHGLTIAPLAKLGRPFRVSLSEVVGHWRRSPRLAPPAVGQLSLVPRRPTPRRRGEEVVRRPVDVELVAEGDLVFVADPAVPYYATVRTRIPFGLAVEPLTRPRVIRNVRRSANRRPLAAHRAAGAAPHAAAVV